MQSLGGLGAFSLICLAIACGPAPEARADWPPISGAPVCTASGAQDDAAIISDGASGAIVVWADARNGLRDTSVLMSGAPGSQAERWSLPG